MKSGKHRFSRGWSARKLRQRPAEGRGSSGLWNTSSRVRCSSESFLFIACSPTFRGASIRLTSATQVCASAALFRQTMCRTLARLPRYKAQIINSLRPITFRDDGGEMALEPLWRVPNNASRFATQLCTACRRAVRTGAVLPPGLEFDKPWLVG
jgi:hypothetical protein